MPSIQFPVEIDVDSSRILSSVEDLDRLAVLIRDYVVIAIQQKEFPVAIKFSDTPNCDGPIRTVRIEKLL